MYYKHGENNAAFYLCTSEDILLAVLKVFFFLCFFWLTFFPTAQGKKSLHTKDSVIEVVSAASFLFFS